MTQTPDIFRTIQAAIGPVVLISGVGLLLLMLTTRLGRTVDRSRLLAAERRGRHADEHPRIDAQLTILAHRARLIRLAVALSAVAVAFTGILVIVLFLAELLGRDLTVVAALLFVASMLSLVAAMLVFVRELLLALAALDVELSEPPG